MPAALIGLAITAVGTIASVSAEKKRASAEREARSISSANENLRNTAAKRKAVREERIRRSRVQQISVNTGVAGSSGEIGATSALSASVGRNIAFQEQETKAAQGISAQNQKAANANSSIANIRAFTNLFQAGVGAGEELGLFE
ncbi:MAG: hypothetical protein GQ574_14645 [Crocinitomix sp.]|nr:hypothetical protein [Crocinitomix sp.]